MPSTPEYRPRAASRARTLAVALAAACALTAAATPADAQQKQQLKQKFTDTIHVVQPKPVLSKMRFELAPRFGVSANDSMHRSFKVGVNANFHILEALYVGGVVDWMNFGSALGGPTDAFEKTQIQTGATPDAAVIDWIAGGEIGYKPIMGKFALLDSAIVYYDVAIFAGGGAVSSKSVQLTAANTGGAGMVGVSSRFFLNKWFALNFEVRDAIFTATLADVGSGVLTNIVTWGAGMSFFLPTAFEYSEKTTEVEGS